MKFYTTTLIFLLVPLAFAGVIRHELPASFRIVYDQDNVNTLSVGSTNLHIKYSNNSLLITSTVGNMEIKNTNESFIVESVPSPGEGQLDLEIRPENAKDSEKYELEMTTTVNPVKHDCRDSTLKELIIKCDGNIRLREYTEEEKAKAKEQRKQFQDRMKQKMDDFIKRMKQIQEMFEKNIGDTRPNLVDNSVPFVDFQPEFLPNFQ